jgi:hypothetical protein
MPRNRRRLNVMRENEASFMLTRRSLLLMAACSPLIGSGGDFWNKKAPSEWSQEEIDTLITHSPWAHEVTASAGEGGGHGPRMGGGGIGFPGGGIGFPGGGGMGGGRGHGGHGGGGQGGEGGQQAKGVVRWESAQPIRDALKSSPPEEFANHYVISVNGFPLRSHGEDSDEIDRLKSFTSLQPKGKAVAQPGVVRQQQTAGVGVSLLFGFDKDVLALGPNDKEVDFATQLGHLTIKTKFNLKEMVYRGAQAL